MADKYLLLTGLNYRGPDGDDVRAEADEVRDDIPEESLPWLLEQQLVVVAPEPKPEPDTSTPSTPSDSAQDAPTAPIITDGRPTPLERLFARDTAPDTASEPPEPTEEKK